MGSYEICLLLCVYVEALCVCQSVVGGRMGEVGVKLVSFGTHKSYKKN
jgi:hypothetical protein